MGTRLSYIWCHQEPTRSAGTRQGIHDATTERMCCGKRSALRTSYVTLKRVPAHERKSISRNLFTFGLMLTGTFLLKWVWGIPRKSLWRRIWDTLYISMYARTNILYNERGSGTNYVRSSIPHCNRSFVWDAWTFPKDRHTWSVHGFLSCRTVSWLQQYDVALLLSELLHYTVSVRAVR